MGNQIRYIELKTGHSDNGPAWIGKVKLSRSGNTLYFNDKAFRKCRGISGNYYDIETHDEYWISGIKKNGADRHWAGNGKIVIQKAIVTDYLEITGETSINAGRFDIADIPEKYPIDRINELENRIV